MHQANMKVLLTVDKCCFIFLGKSPYQSSFKVQPLGKLLYPHHQGQTSHHILPRSFEPHTISLPWHCTCTIYGN